MTVVPPTRAASRTAPLRREGDGRGVLSKYPRSALRRWLMRLALALPFLALSALLSRAEGVFLHDTANAALVAHVSEIRGGTVSIDLLAQLYPPVSTLIAMVVPYGVIGLAVVGSLASGFLVQRVVEWLVRRHLGPVERVAFVLMLAGTPLLALMATTNLEVTLGLTFFAVGMIDLVRFIVYANTQAGFRVGLLFALAALAAPAFLFSVVIAACVGPFLAHSRRGARGANALVIVFPTAAAFGTVTLLGVVFRGDPLIAFGQVGLAFSPERMAAVAGILASGWGWLFFVPSAAGMLLALLQRRPTLAAAVPLLTASMLLMILFGVTPQGSTGITYLLLVTVLFALAPRSRTFAQRSATIILTACTFASAWLMSLLILPSVQTWAVAIAEGWQAWR